MWLFSVAAGQQSLAGIFTSRTDTGRLRIEHQTVGRHRVVAENLALEDPHLDPAHAIGGVGGRRSEEHMSELQSLMRISYAVFCLKKKKYHVTNINDHIISRNVKHTTDLHYLIL